MQKRYDIRVPKDREDLACFLPTIDGVDYAISRAQLLERLEAVSRHVPENVPLTYQRAMFSIFHNSFSLATIVQLGEWILVLRDCPGFEDSARGFSNPTQFLDTHFEMRVAAFFAKQAACSDLRFGVKYDVRGHTKRPEFTVQISGRTAVVECKRVHFSLSRLQRKFTSNCELIDDEMARAGFPDSHRLEVEIVSPEREHFPLIASKAVATAISIAKQGEGSQQVGNLLLHVCLRETAFAIPLDRKGLQRNTIVLPVANQPVSIVDHRCTRLRVLNSRYSNAFLRLVTAAIVDARSQLPAGLAGVVCIGDVPPSFAEETFGPGHHELTFPENVVLVMLWHGDQIQAHFPESAMDFVATFLPVP